MEVAFLSSKDTKRKDYLLKKFKKPIRDLIKKFEIDLDLDEIDKLGQNVSEIVKFSKIKGISSCRDLIAYRIVKDPDIEKKVIPFQDYHIGIITDFIYGKNEDVFNNTDDLVSRLYDSLQFSGSSVSETKEEEYEEKPSKSESSKPEVKHISPYDEAKYTHQDIVGAISPFIFNVYIFNQDSSQD